MRDSWSAAVPRLDANGNRIYVNNEGQVVASTTPGAIAAFDLSKSTYTGLGANPDHFARTATNFYSHTINAYTTYAWNLNGNNAFKFILGVNRVTGSTEFQTSQITNLLDIYNPQFPFGNDENGDPIRSPAGEAAAANTANILQNYSNFSLGSTVNITSNWNVEFDYTYSNQ